MKHSTCFLLLSGLLAPSLSAQSVAEHRTYFRLGGAYHMNDMKAYLGDRAFSPIYELGHDFKGPTESTGFGVYVSYITGHGDSMSQYRYFKDFKKFDGPNGLVDPGQPGAVRGVEPDYLNDGMKQILFGWRFGADLRYRTPISGLTAFIGFSANWWDGRVLEPGTVRQYNNRDLYYEIPYGPWPDGQAKAGWRIGAEYRITDHWGVTWDTSISSWLSRNNNGRGQETLTGQYAYKGINPVNPSWMNFAVQYRWSLFN